MDAFNDPKVETVVLMCSAQIGKTEILNNVVGYYMDQDPSPILVMQPNVTPMAKAWSKDRLAPMLRDTPCLQDKVQDRRSRDSDNTIEHKAFPGGHITIVGANSAAGLSSRPIRIVLCDEPDRYPPSAGPEGDPVKLGFKRTTTFWNKKKALFSTPTQKGFSRIEAWYALSDKRKYHVPCTKCGAFQVLRWAHVQWPKGEPDKVKYVCELCGGHLDDRDISRMVKRGKWVAESDCTGIAGFWLWECYSPWVTLRDMVKEWYESKDNPETLKVFINTTLGEVSEDEVGEGVDDEGLFARREDYGAEVPAKAHVLTAGVDIQDDRIECEVVGWGCGEESWSITYKTFYGLPAEDQVWKDLDTFLQTTFLHEYGVLLRISCTCIDTGGHHTKRAYGFVKERQNRRIFAVKGSNQPGRPLVGRPTKSNLARVNLFPVGVDTAKDLIFGRLKIQAEGPGYMHFPLSHDNEYFLQLTAETVKTKFSRGFATRVWVKKRPRNEALDCRVYATAAVEILQPNYEKLAKVIESKKGSAGAPADPFPLKATTRRMLSSGL